MSADSCVIAFVRRYGHPAEPLLQSSPRENVIRIENRHTEQWAEYDVTRWRIRRIADSGPGPKEAGRRIRQEVAGDEDLAAIADQLTINAATTLRDHHGNAAEPRMGAPHTGTGRYTALAAYGVLQSLRKAGSAMQPSQDTATGKWAITPLGLRVAAYLRENWGRLHLRDPAADARNRRAAMIARDLERARTRTTAA